MNCTAAWESILEPAGRHFQICDILGTEAVPRAWSGGMRKARLGFLQEVCKAYKAYRPLSHQQEFNTASARKGRGVFN